jgi:hypothetical protein
VSAKRRRDTDPRRPKSASRSAATLHLSKRMRRASQSKGCARGYALRSKASGATAKMPSLTPSTSWVANSMLNAGPRFHVDRRSWTSCTERLSIGEVGHEAPLAARTASGRTMVATTAAALSGRMAAHPAAELRLACCREKSVAKSTFFPAAPYRWILHADLGRARPRCPCTTTLVADWSSRRSHVPKRSSLWHHAAVHVSVHMHTYDHVYIHVYVHVYSCTYIHRCERDSIS